MARQARGVKTSRLIIETAAQVFCELGYAGATTTEILSRCDMTRGALYFHFASKRDLALGVLAEASEVRWPSERRLALQRLIECNLEYAYRLQTDVVDRASVLLRAELRPGSAALPQRGDVREVFLHLLREAGEAGETTPGTDPREVADVLTGASAPVELFRTDREAELTRHVATLWRYLLPALSRPGLLLPLESFLDRAEQHMRERGTAPSGSRWDGGAA